MSQVLSNDGTPIAYERSGSGPALILIDGALCSRAFGPSPKLAPLLANASPCSRTTAAAVARAATRNLTPRSARSKTSRR